MRPCAIGVVLALALLCSCQGVRYVRSSVGVEPRHVLTVGVETSPAGRLEVINRGPSKVEVVGPNNRWVCAAGQSLAKNVPEGETVLHIENASDRETRVTLRLTGGLKMRLDTSKATPLEE